MNIYEIDVPDEGVVLRDQSAHTVSLVGRVNLLDDLSPILHEFFFEIGCREQERKLRAIAAIGKFSESPLSLADKGRSQFVLSWLPTRCFGKSVAQTNGFTLDSHYCSGSPFATPANRAILEVISEEFRACEYDGFIHTRTRHLRDHSHPTATKWITEQLAFEGTKKQRRSRSRLQADDYPTVPQHADGTVLTPTIVLTVFNSLRPSGDDKGLDPLGVRREASDTARDVTEFNVSSTLVNFDDVDTRRAGLTSFMYCGLPTWLSIISNVRRQLINEGVLRPRRLKSPDAKIMP